MDSKVLLLSLVIFIVCMILYVSLNKVLKEKKPLKSLLELLIGISLVVSLVYLFL
ncbi:hypothetical protein [Bacillus thuringiensis]|uniref:hypothetical protein n=1 Tax=Bacillus thuringiensis TaxID=1428 RepID=UPI000A66F9A4|nr:hypothetical protein [Bacillus thuringiensis]